VDSKVETGARIYTCGPVPCTYLEESIRGASIALLLLPHSPNITCRTVSISMTVKGAQRKETRTANEKASQKAGFSSASRHLANKHTLGKAHGQDLVAPDFLEELNTSEQHRMINEKHGSPNAK